MAAIASKQADDQARVIPLLEVYRQFVGTLDQFEDVRDRLLTHLAAALDRGGPMIVPGSDRHHAITEVLEFMRAELDLSGARHELEWEREFGVAPRGTGMTAAETLEVDARHAWVLAPHHAMTINNAVLGDIRFREDLDDDERAMILASARRASDEAIALFDELVARFVSEQPIRERLITVEHVWHPERTRRAIAFALDDPSSAAYRRPFPEAALRAMLEEIRAEFPLIVERQKAAVWTTRAERVNSEPYEPIAMRRATLPSQLPVHFVNPEALFAGRLSVPFIDYTESHGRGFEGPMPAEINQLRPEEQEIIRWNKFLIQEVISRLAVTIIMKSGRRTSDEPIDRFDPLCFVFDPDLFAGYMLAHTWGRPQLTIFDARYGTLQDFRTDPRYEPGAPPLTEPYRPDTRLALPPGALEPAGIQVGGPADPR